MDKKVELVVADHWRGVCITKRGTPGGKEDVVLHNVQVWGKHGKNLLVSLPIDG